MKPLRFPYTSTGPWKYEFLKDLQKISKEYPDTDPKILKHCIRIYSSPTYFNQRKSQ